MWNKGKRYRVNETKSRKNRIKQLFFITILIVTVFGIVSILTISSILNSQPSNTDVGISIRPMESHSVATAVGTTIDNSVSSKDISENSTQISAATTLATLTTTQVLTTEPTEEQAEKSWLIDIGNPDYDYTPQAISLSDGEREEIARIVMGEFGDSDFTGCALLAQSIRDGMATYGFSGYSVQSGMQYYGYNSNPNQTCYEAVDWIFSGNAAVQHRILIMNNAYGGWHATQNFVVYYDGVWFYDLW